MLEYENEMFLSALQEDGLTIVAKGLGLENMFTNLLKVSKIINLMFLITCRHWTDLEYGLKNSWTGSNWNLN